MTPDDVRALAESSEPRLGVAWATVVTAMRDTHTLTRLAQLLAAGRLEDATEAVLRQARRFPPAWAREFARAGEATAEDIAAALSNVARGEVVLDFDMVHQDAVNAIQQNRLRLVREITEAQRRAIREAITEGVRRGDNPIAQARNFRDSLGLTERQVRAVNNYRRLLEQNNPEALERALRDRRFDRSVARALEDGTPLTRRQIDNMVARYRERYLKYRTEVIARTEALRSAHEGTFSMFRQAIADGSLSDQSLTREWNTAGDERVRTFESTGGKTSHASMHGQVVQGMSEPFISGGGNALLYPGDPSAPGEDTIQCRCAVGVRMSAVSGPVLSAQVVQ